MDFYVLFNFIEAWYWIAVAALLASGSFIGKAEFRQLYRAAFISIVLFGCSDFVEMKTGSWYKPWWLLVWKGMCILAFVFIFLWYRRIRSYDKRKELES